MKVQVIGVLVTVVWTALVSAVAYKLVDLLIGLRVEGRCRAVKGWMSPATGESLQP